MKVNRSSYYAWEKRGEPKTSKENRMLAQIVKETHAISKESYGARRHASELTDHGIFCGRYRASSLMKLAGVEAKQKRKFKATTDSNHNLKVFPNVLKREFVVTAPNTVWVSDITYIRTSAGWLYLAVVIDLFNREVVGWSMGKHIDRHLVINAVRMAVWKQKPGKGLIFHSDRGSQYCSNEFKKYIAGHGILGSMSRKGNCWDNAVAESFFGSLKKERVYSMSYKSRRNAKDDIVDYIEMFYNSFRKHSFLGNKSPREFMKIWQDEKKAA
jgi:putative transposase